jgi:hypothetical protein
MGMGVQIDLNSVTIEPTMKSALTPVRLYPGKTIDLVTDVADFEFAFA